VILVHVRRSCAVGTRSFASFPVTIVSFGARPENGFVVRESWLKRKFGDVRAVPGSQEPARQAIQSELKTPQRTVMYLTGGRQLDEPVVADSSERRASWLRPQPRPTSSNIQARLRSLTLPPEQNRRLGESWACASCLGRPRSVRGRHGLTEMLLS
jgi:hypothetical protein